MKIKHKKHRERGQSLVETALILPVLLIILAGLVEISQLAITKNRVSQAVRTSARFGATGGQDEGMVTVALNTITQTLDMSAGVWDLWVIRGHMNPSGTDFSPGTWEFTHVYGISNTVAFTSVNEANIRQEILNDLRANVADSVLSDVDIVGMYALHDVESILGLDALPWLTGFYSIRGLNYMRKTAAEVVQTNGCDAFPISVLQGIRSLGVGSSSYPTNFDYPSPAPPGPAEPNSPFVNHRDNQPLNTAREGDLFVIADNLGQLDWLRWTTAIGDSGTALANSLRWPGNSLDYTTVPAPGYVDPDDSSDTSLHVGDRVLSTDQFNNGPVRAQLNGHVDTGRQLRFIVREAADPPGGGVRINQFAVFRLHGYHLDSGGGSWLLAEFIRLDNSCGQQQP